MVFSAFVKVRNFEFGPHGMRRMQTKVVKYIGIFGNLGSFDHLGKKFRIRFRSDFRFRHTLLLSC